MLQKNFLKTKQVGIRVVIAPYEYRGMTLLTEKRVRNTTKVIFY